MFLATKLCMRLGMGAPELGWKLIKLEDLSPILPGLFQNGTKKLLAWLNKRSQD